MNSSIASGIGWVRISGTQCAAEVHEQRGGPYDLTNSWTGCAIDEGGPFGIGFQEPVSNHLQAAAVKSRGGVRWRKSARLTRAGVHPRDERK